jgi:chorismate dehydratase
MCPAGLATGPKIAASNYLNAAPLWYSFAHGKQRGRCSLISDAAPSRCADLLREGRVAAALIPAIEYQRIPGLLVAPGACVASKNRVRSVILASRVPIERISSVALDSSSRTSAALVQIILSRFRGVRPRYLPHPPNINEMLESNDAALIIGDPAMMVDRSALYVYDLAEEWKRHTGLPFVFAFWAVRAEAATGLRDRGVDFAEARREGLSRASQIAEIYSGALGLPKNELLAYLTENIHYDLDPESLRGLNLYYEMAREAGFINQVRDLRFSH